MLDKSYKFDGLLFGAFCNNKGVSSFKNSDGMYAVCEVDISKEEEPECIILQDITKDEINAYIEGIYEAVRKFKGSANYGDAHLAMTAIELYSGANVWDRVASRECRLRDE